jgi:DnaJ-domain-containing protein 1
MQELLKRLDIIKNAVAMEDEELIAMQVAKLQALPLDARVKQILTLITAKQFQYVIQLIEQYKQDNSGVMVYEDPQIKGLKLELKVLENRLNELTDTQAELERQINEFNSEYMQRLGGLIEEILKKRAQLPSDNPEQQQEAQQDYENFERSYQQQLKDTPQTLTAEEQQQLKAAYRKASRLCHPDKLAEEFKEQGAEIFKALNEAYRRQDLARVLEILQHLETGKLLSSASDSINDKTALKNKIAALRLRIAELEAEITALQNSEIYQRIQQIEDRERYFAELEEQLQIELNALADLES